MADVIPLRPIDAATSPNPSASPGVAQPMPMLWDERGIPLVPDEDPGAQWKGQAIPPIVPALREEARGVPGSIPSYPIAHWISVRLSQEKTPDTRWVPGRRDSWDDSDLRVAFVRIATGSTTPQTLLWSWERRLFALGAATDTVQFIARHHKVELPTEAIDKLRSALQQLNPFRGDSERWRATFDEIERTCGVRLRADDLPTSEWRLFPFVSQDPPLRLVMDDARLEQMRALLRDLASRPVKAPWQKLSISFVLEKLAGASLRMVETEGRVTFRCLGELGDGTVVLISAFRFPGEPAGTLELIGDRTWDSGDVRFELLRTHDELLPKRGPA